MKRNKPSDEYETVVVKQGNGARIKAYKKHIGKKAKVIVE